MASFAPTELVANPNLTFTSPHIDKVRAEGKRDLAIANVRVGNRPARMFLQGQLTTDGINKTEHETFGDKWSFGFQFANEEDRDAILELNRKAEEFLQQEDRDNAYEMREPFKDDVLYLKLKPNSQGNGFKVTSNYKLHPKKPNTDITRWMNLELKVDPGLYINVGEFKAGIYFSVLEINFKQADSEPDVTDAESNPSQELLLGPPTTPVSQQRRQSAPHVTGGNRTQPRRRQ